MISAQNITKTYHNKTVLNQISFELNYGDMVGLVGPNGVGKTTLLSSMMGLIPLDNGKVVMADTSFSETDMYRKVGFMQDNSVLYPYLTGYDHLAYVAYAQNIKESEIEKISRRVGNFDYLHKKIGEYSLGMKQHLLFASAILHNPKVLLLDEPFNGLDPTSLIRIRELIEELSDNKTTVILSSHNLDEIDRMTRNIFFLKDGDILYRNLAKYKIYSYLITVSQLPDKEILRNLSVEERINNQLLVSKEQVNPLIYELNQQAIEILDIERTQFGSENLYREIYHQAQ